MTSADIQILFSRWLSGSVTTEEYEWLVEAAQETGMDTWQDALVPIISNTLVDESYHPEDWSSVIENILHHPEQQKTKIIFIHTIYKWIAAAAVIVIIGITAYLWNSKQQKTHEDSVATLFDVAAPTTARALITLSNGRQIALDSLSEGVFTPDNKVNFEKHADGSISYKKGVENEMVYNTISVPRGSSIVHLVLSDGTIVFLNNETTLRYPVAFSTKERIVEMNGEAYFIVSKDAKRKFMVKANGLMTEVLGTQFNMSNYENDKIKKVTLLEGKIKVLKDAEAVVLQPRQQAQSADSLRNVGYVRVEEVIAWKEGKFRFTNTPIEEAMKQFSRWYDLEVEYHLRSDQTFSGSMPRSLSAANAFKILEATGGARFQINGKKVIVMN